MGSTFTCAVGQNNATNECGNDPKAQVNAFVLFIIIIRQNYIVSL